MQCKNHNDREGLTVCSVCNEYFCDECIDAETHICVSCKEKQELSNDILNDIMNTVEIPEQSKINFDPTDILTQIENEINIQQQIEKLDVEINSVVNAQSSDISEDIPNTNEQLILTETVVSDDVLDSSSVSEVVVSETIVSDDILDNDTISEVVISETVVNDEILDNNTISEVVVSETIVSDDVLDNNSVSENIDLTKDDVSKSSSFKEKFFSKKEHSENKSKTTDSNFIKDTANDLANSTKKQASKLSEDANNLKNKMKNSINSKENTQSDEEIDEIVEKIKKTNKNGEYDHLLSRFSSRYGEGADDVNSDNSDDEQNLALPLRINSILYFIASLIPGGAQLYLGLTKRGTTILIIAAVFLFITHNPSLFLITTILSFADAQKLRNIYYRGGKIEDTNTDIMSLIKNGYVVIIIIAAVILGV